MIDRELAVINIAFKSTSSIKKFLTAFAIIMLISIQPVLAKNVKVEALSDFSTANPPETWQVKVVDGFMTKGGFIVYPGSILEGKIMDVTGPKRLKRNAAFVFVPIKYYDAYHKCETDLTEKMSAKYSPLTDVTVGSVAKTGVIFVGNRLADGFFGPGIALVEGAVKNEQGNRAKSAVVSVYESSPLSYISKGNDIEIAKGKVFIMSFKIFDDETDNETQAEIENKPNYTYTIE